MTLLDIPPGAGRLKVLPDYEIEFDAEPYLVLVFGTLLGTAPDRFTHPNLLGKRYVVHRFKHYHANGRKSWTAHPGGDLYLALPKAAIKVVPEHGYSYPKVVIAGKAIRLNVSGGGGAVWVDHVGTSAAGSVNLPVATLRPIANAALSVRQAQALGIRLNLSALQHSDNALLKEALARRAARPLLRPGQTVQLIPGVTASDETRLPIHSVPSGREQAYVCGGTEYGRRYRVAFSRIDWDATCRLNGIDVTMPVDAFNTLPPEPGEAPPAPGSDFDFGDVLIRVCGATATA